MAHFPRIRTSSLWVSGGVLLASEMDAFDDHLSKAVNGDEGGVWSPSSLLEIGGAGVRITGAFTVTSNAQLQGGAIITGGNLSVAQNASIQGNATVGGTCTVTGATSLNGGCTVTGGNLTVAQSVGVQDDLNVGDALNVGGNTQIGGTCTVTGVTTHTGGVTCSSYLSVVGDATFNANASVVGALVVAGAAVLGGGLNVPSPSTANLSGMLATTATGGTLTKPITSSATGRLVRRVYKKTSDTDETIGINDCDVVFLAAAVISALRTLTISNVGAVEGDVIKIFTRESSNALRVNCTYHSVDLKYGSLTNSLSMELCFIDGEWRMSDLGSAAALFAH